MAKSKDYWKQRFEEIEQSQYKSGIDYYNDLQKQYRMANNDIQMEISKWYLRLADNNEISLQAAKKLLKADELKEFHWNVEEYIKYGKENALDQSWMKELENASAKVHISKLEAMKLQTQQQIEKLFTEYADGTTEFLDKTFRNQYYHTAYEIAKGTGVGTNLHEIDSKVIDNVLNRPWAMDGSNFSNRIWNNKQKLVNSLNTELTQGIIRGTSAQKMIENISKQMDVSKNQAGALVVTESAAISSKAQQQCFLDLDIERYEIVATLDTHTSNICRDLDGKVFDMKDYVVGSTAPPFHVRCRTVTVPYFDDLGGERVARDENGNEVFVDANIKYDEWYNKFVKNNPTYELEVKKLKNINSDSKQYEEYINVLKKAVPKSLDDFQNIKYNDNDTWSKLQLSYKDQKIRDTIRSESIIKTVESGKQGKHIKGHNNYIEGRSYLTISEQEAQELIKKFAGLGEILRDNKGQWKNQEIIDFKKVIGVNVDNLTGTTNDTTKAKVHYSKKGVHIVPYGKEGMSIESD